jgi:hypothetical protein
MFPIGINYQSLELHRIDVFHLWKLSQEIIDITEDFIGIKEPNPIFSSGEAQNP